MNTAANLMSGFLGWWRTSCFTVLMPGGSDPDIDMCSLVLIKKGDREIEKAVAALGDMVDLEGGFFVAPFIKVATIEEWRDERRQEYSPFPHVSGDGVSIL